MRGRVWLFQVLVVVLVLQLARSAAASVVINEILADPPTGLAGDANNDLVRSSSNDEFIELLNYSEAPVDISAWVLADYDSTRHIFLPNTVLSPYEYIVIFGGGLPNLSAVKWQKASTGSLSLNNSGDTVRLLNSQNILMNEYAYGVNGGKGQSLVRSPEGSGSDFVLHSTVVVSNGTLYSAGKSVTGEPLQTTNSVPEPMTIISFISLVGFLLKRI